MKIVSVSLDGFGRLTNHTFEFGSGFNLIFGLNETGKSTLQRAIVTLLYGFFSEGRINAADRAAVEAFRPWDEMAPYADSLVYTMGNDQSYRIERTFGTNAATSIYALPDGKDISNSFPKQNHGRVFFADAHLGMPKEVFENTSYIRQAELIALESSASAITDTLMRLSASASSDNTVTNAISLLQNTHKEQVGSLRARTKPLAQTHARLTKLEDERKHLLARRAELASGLIELNQVKVQVSQLEQKLEETRYLEAMAIRTDLQQKVDAVQLAAQELKDKTTEVEKWADWAEFPAHLRDEVLTLSDRYRTLQTETWEGKKEADEASRKLQELAVKITAGEAQIEQLSTARVAQPELLPQLRDLTNQWLMARQEAQRAGEQWHKSQSNLAALEKQINNNSRQLKPIVELGYAGLAQLKHQWTHAHEELSEAKTKLAKAEQDWSKTGIAEPEFIALAQQVHRLETAAAPVPDRPRKGCNLFASNRSSQPSISVPPEIKIYQDLEPIYTAMMMARAELKAAQESVANVESNIYRTTHLQKSQPLDDGIFDKLNQVLERYRQLETTLNHQKESISDLTTDLDKARRKESAAGTALEARLLELGLDIQDLQLAVDNYAEMCERKVTLDRVEAELNNLQLQGQAQDRIITLSQQKHNQLCEAGSKLQDILVQAEIECQLDESQTLDTALNEFDQGFSNHKRWLEAQQQRDQAITHLKSLDNLEKLQNSLSELDNRLSQMRNARPQFADLQTNEPANSYGAQLKTLESDLTVLQHQFYDLQNTVGQSDSDSRHLAEVDEEISQTRTEMQKLEWYGAILEQAQRQLTEATEEFQKQFAPKLEKLMSDGLNQSTYGRYPDLHVDPGTLAVAVVAPETGQPVSAEFLSTGTRELVYLMLRVSVARLMSRTGEQLPLLLDDPLVQSDRRRQEQTLAYLSQLAEEMQVFLFTKDEWVKDWFEEKLVPHRTHSLVTLT